MVMAPVLAALSISLAQVTPGAALRQADPSSRDQGQPTPGEARGLALLKAADQANASDFLALVARTDPAPSLPYGGWEPLRNRIGHLVLHQAHAEGSHAQFVAYDPDREKWMLLSLDVSPQPPHDILQLTLVPTSRPLDIPAPEALGLGQLVTAARAKILAEVSQGRFSGVVLIGRNGRPVFEQAEGLADAGNRTPNTLSTRFRFASVGKLFTAVAVFQLVQAGKLDLNAPIHRYLPDYPNIPVARLVTINELLTHTSGFGDVFGPDSSAHHDALRDPADYIRMYSRGQTPKKVGDGFQYSNYGFIVIGRVVEAASGMHYDDYIKQHILDPAGMTQTGFAPEHVHVPDRSKVYTVQGDGLKDVDDTLPFRGSPAGGGYSTAADLLDFASALQGHQLLDSKFTELLEFGGIKLPDGSTARYDFRAKTSEGYDFIGHSGGGLGEDAELRIFPSTGYCVIVLSNVAPPLTGTVIADFISNRLPRN